MISQMLRDARKYEEKMEKELEAVERPGFHLSARTGWMNDPNGFSFYQGKYHLFYQYYPYAPHWDSMHWAHAVSEDLLHWEHLPAALAPDAAYDRDGCFSGSAAALPDGRQILLYTGVVKETQPDGTVRDVQEQCIALGDGIDYEKPDCNPVIDRNALPADGSKYDFRDPKLWRKEDGSYRCVVGNCTKEGDGRVLLYSSQDGIHWRYEKVFAANGGRFGRMWECPDFFVLDGKGVLITSPTDMLAQGLEYPNGNGTLCLTGSYDERTDTLTEEHDQAIDYGIDFYAPQTMLAPDGRRVMVGWLQNWDTCKLYTPELPWFGQMSLPRELSVKNGRLYQRPVRELESLHRAGVRHQAVAFSGSLMLEGVKGRRVDMEISVRPGDGQQLYRRFEVSFARKEDIRTSVSYRPSEAVLELDRRFAGSRRAAVHRSCCRVPGSDGTIKLRVILDSFSAEIFVNDGEYVLSATIYTDAAADGIAFFADGLVTMDVVKYDIAVK